MAPSECKSKEYQTIKFIRDESQDFAEVIFARSDVRNAFNAEMIEELIDVFSSLKNDNKLRALFISGEGKNFCAGADLNWMKKSATYSEEENLKDARRLSLLFKTLNELDTFTVAFAHGATMGGGLGLLCAADHVVCSRDFVGALSEVKLGLIPAVISPYVISKMGQAAARSLMISGRRFSAHDAFHYNLATKLVESQNDFAEEKKKIKEELNLASPLSIKKSKELFFNAFMGEEKLCSLIAQLRTTENAQEGMKAMLEKRKASWVK